MWIVLVLAPISPNFIGLSCRICFFESDLSFATFVLALRIQILSSDLREAKGNTASVRLIVLLDDSGELLSVLRRFDSHPWECE